MKTIFFLLIVVSSAWAKDVRLRLDEAAGYALAHNPDLRAAALRIEEARGRLRGAGRFTNPEITGEFDQNVRTPEHRIALGFEQRFPVTARLRLARRLSEREVAMAETEVRDQRRKLIGEVEAAAVRLISVELLRGVREKQVTLSKQLVDTAIKRSATGEIAPADTAQMLIDSQQAELELRQLDAQDAALTGEIKPLLGLNARDSLTLVGPLPAPSSVRAGSGDRPDLERARIEEEAAAVALDLARARKWEDVGVGLMVERERSEDAPDGLSNDTMIGLRFRLPLPLWNKNDGEIAEKAARRARAAEETQALAARIANEAAAARAEMQAHARLASETREKLLPLVLQQAERLESAYSVGETDLITLLRTRDQRFKLEAAALAATRDYHLARARYRAATATHPALRK